MRHTKIFFTSAIPVILVLFVAGAKAQPQELDPSPSKTPQASIRLAISALDDKGQPILDLTQNDIQVFEGKQGLQIQSLTSTQHEALRLGILIDVSGSQRESAEAIDSQSLISFLHAIMRKDVYALVIGIGATPSLVLDWTDDLPQLEKGIEATLAAPKYGSSAVYDSIYAACRERLASQRGRKVLLVISDMRDNTSMRTLDESAEAALKSQIAVYTVIFQDMSEVFTTRSTGRIAERTGGLRQVVGYKGQFSEALQRVAAALAGSYVLDLAPAPSSNKAGFHKIKVECLRKNIKLLVPQGYIIASK